MSTLANTPRDKVSQIFVDPRFVSEVQAVRHWQRKREGTGWRVRTTHETVFNMSVWAISAPTMERLVAFYLVDYGDDSTPVSEEYSDVLFTMPISDFLYEYEPVLRVSGEIS